MSTHDYTPEQALEVLMQKLGSGDEQLAAEIRAAIDTGKDVAESEPSSRRKKPRTYRKTVPFSYEEALQVAISALQAHFIEQPLFANSCAANMSRAAIGTPRDPRHATFGRSGRSVDLTVQAEGEEKTVMIELQTETQISRSEQSRNEGQSE